MKKTRKILFSLGLIAILVGISILCLIIGRGHTVYLDNKTIGDYKAYQYIEISYKGEDVAILGKEERTVVKVIGQKCTLDLVLTEKRNSMDEEKTITVELPYDMNDIVLNINSYLEGADEDTYITEFVSLMQPAENTGESENVNIDEFNMEGLEG